MHFILCKFHIKSISETNIKFWLTTHMHSEVFQESILMAAIYFEMHPKKEGLMKKGADRYMFKLV